MTDSGDYRLYLTEKFEGLYKVMNAQFENVHDKLDAIEVQTGKTNSRVTHLEDKLMVVEETLLTHPINCIHGEKIDKIKDDLEEYRVFKKYPKIGIVIIAIFTILLAIGAYGTIGTIHNTRINKGIEKTVDKINEDTK